MDGSYDPATLVHAEARFTPPRLRREFVVRDHLVGRVLSPEPQLVVVSGPAGSGKSTLLAQAAARCADAVWLSIEPSDDDPAVLWSALIDSTARTVPGFGDEYRHHLDIAGGEAVEHILPRFLNEIASTARNIRFFLDDLHLLSGERSLASLHRLVVQLPADSRVVIASRAAAPFSLGRLRLERAIVEIDATDLAMGVDEAQAALAAAGVEADEDQVAALVDRMEGWVAGLAWAMMAMQESSDTTSFVEAINGIGSELAGYLIEEVLEQRSPEVRAFMLDTSILTRFDAALCDRLRGRDDSRAFLDELDRTNSFLVPLDRHGGWFRYHHLVHEVLAARLEHESASRVPALHRRASSWLCEHGEIGESIRHARAAGDHRDAADILCAHWWEMMNSGRVETAHALFEGFGSAEICAYQPLAIAATALYSVAGEHQRAQVFYRAAERGHHEGAPPDGSASIESSLAIMRGAVAFDGVDAVLAAGTQACELEPEHSPWRPFALFLVAIGHVWRGELDAAEPLFADAVGRAQVDDAVVVYAGAQLALIRLAQDDLDGALSAAESACAVAEASGLDTLFVTAIAHGAAAMAKLTSGDNQAAERHLDAARRPMEAVNAAMPLDAMHTRIVLADAATRLGRLSEASEYVDDAYRTRNRYRDTGVLAGQLDAVAERLRGSAEVGPLEPLSERERAVLDLMASERSIRKIAEALYISQETVKTHRRNIYRKLAVTSRADAVVAARRAGLLPETANAGASP